MVSLNFYELCTSFSLASSFQIKATLIRYLFERARSFRHLALVFIRLIAQLDGVIMINLLFIWLYHWCIFLYLLLYIYNFFVLL